MPAFLIRGKRANKSVKGVYSMREAFVKLLEAYKEMASSADYSLPESSEEIDLGSVQLNEIMELYRDMDLIVSPAMAALEAVGKMIKIRVLEEGATARFENVTAKYTRSSIRAGWDTKGLLKYGEKHPDILLYQTTTTVGASCSIKVDPIVATTPTVSG
jgi:hypothetical protein